MVQLLLVRSGTKEQRGRVGGAVLGANQAGGDHLLVMPTSASSSFSQPRALEEKVTTSSCAKFDFLQLLRLEFVQNRKLVRLRFSKNSSGQNSNLMFGEANPF